ncbi:DUF2752 domain-containing protein, partial [Actinomadura sp. BRA 177]|nr:DUF2752 domain-containing protein [Actinomadura sp. BRA 177]
MAVAAIGAAWLHRVNDPGVLCPLRALTGVPCPLCGRPTASTALASGRPVHAGPAHPVARSAAIASAPPPRARRPRRTAPPPPTTAS